MRRGVGRGSERWAIELGWGSERTHRIGVEDPDPVEALDLAELLEEQGEVPPVAWPVQVVLVGVLGDQVELLGARGDQHLCLVDHIVKVLASKFAPVFVVRCASLA